jgi:single-stranded DNA-binding protein
MSKKGYDGQEKPCPEGWKESYNKKGWEYVQWWRVTVFGARAKTCIDHLSKGDWVHFEGRMAGTVVDGVMNPTVWAGRDGAQHASYELVANDVEFLGKSADGGSRASQASDIDDIDPQNIPF